MFSITCTNIFLAIDLLKYPSKLALTLNATYYLLKTVLKVKKNQNNSILKFLHDFKCFQSLP